MTADDKAQMKREVVEQATQELAARKVRFTDRRLLLIYLVLTLSIIGFLFLYGQQERKFKAQTEEFQVAITQVCNDLEDSHMNINALLDQLAASAQNRPDRTPEQKAEAQRIYEGLKLADLTCPASTN